MQPRLTGVIDEIRQAQQARSFQPPSAQEIDAGLREGDDDYERKLQGAPTTTATPPAGGP
jgi:hypothetical protein